MIKQLGEGNFTKIYKVFHKKFPQKYYAMKICCQQKVKSLRKETDIMMEKHALNKLKSAYADLEKTYKNLPCVKIIGTFKDESNLYFLTEML